MFKKILLSSVLLLFGINVFARSPLEPVKLDNPRDTMATFIEAMNDYRKGVANNNKSLKSKIDRAVRTLNLEDVPAVLRNETGVETAKILKEVIDRIIVIDFEKIPDDPNLQRWRLKDTEITLIKVTSGARSGEFLFSKDTVERAKTFYEKVKHLPYLKDSGKGALYKEAWIERSVPDWAKKKSLGLENWKIIGLFLSIFLGLLLKTIAELSLKILEKIASKTASEWDDRIVLAIEKPIGLIVACGFWFLSLHVLQFEGIVRSILTVVIQLILSGGIIWVFYDLTEVLTDFLKKAASKSNFPLDDQMVPLIHKSLKIFVVAFGILIMFQNMGINVMSILAGLGLGGLAFALAAKDACANLFGSIMIFVDQPFRVGDWIVVGGVEGTVEEIGFRSTRLRTFHKSVVSIPNSVVANANIDNMGRRTFRRIRAVFGLKYDTPPERIEAFLEGVKNIVKANPYTDKSNFHVVFHSYGDATLNMLLYCFLSVPDWGKELVERQNIYLEILRLAHKIGVEFAFPTQTLHVESFPEKSPYQNDVIANEDDLKKWAEGFGPQGSFSKPKGLGLFRPPFEDHVSS